MAEQKTYKLKAGPEERAGGVPFGHGVTFRMLNVAWKMAEQSNDDDTLVPRFSCDLEVMDTNRADFERSYPKTWSVGSAQYGVNEKFIPSPDGKELLGLAKDARIGKKSGYGKLKASIEEAGFYDRVTGVDIDSTDVTPFEGMEFKAVAQEDSFTNDKKENITFHVLCVEELLSIPAVDGRVDDGDDEDDEDDVPVIKKKKKKRAKKAAAAPASDEDDSGDEDNGADLNSELIQFIQEGLEDDEDGELKLSRLGRSIARSGSDNASELGEIILNEKKLAKVCKAAGVMYDSSEEVITVE